MIYKIERKKTFGVVFFLHLLLKRGKESVRIFKGGYYERDRTGKILFILHLKYTIPMCLQCVTYM